MTLVLTASVLETLADLPATIAAVEHAFAAIAEGGACQPAPTSLHLPSSDGRFILMSGLGDAERLAGVKLLADIPANRDAGLPTQRSSIVLSDQQTGECLALLDGRVPTRVRTAAASAVATLVSSLRAPSQPRARGCTLSSATTNRSSRPTSPALCR